MEIKRKRLFHLVVSLSILAVGGLGLTVLIASKPQIKRQKPLTPLPLVRTMTVQTGPRQIVITGEGTVTPLQEVQVAPQVGGEVIFVSPSLVNGGEFRKGEILLRIDPADYKLAVTLARAKVEDAESKLKLAEQEAAAAREEWRSLHGDRKQGGKPPPPLVAKEPQLAAARANLEAAQADLEKALLNLRRTELKAPFNCRVAQEKVGPGQHVSPGQVLATLYSTDAAEIAIPLEKEALYWFHVPGLSPGEGPGAKAEVTAEIAGQERTWPARVVRSEGKVNIHTRMIHVVVRVEEPFSSMPPLMPGLFVAVEIKGHTLPNASVIPASALRENDEVWVIEGEDRLRFRKVSVARRNDNRIIVASGLKQGEKVVISSLKAVTEGMKVRVLPEKGGHGS